VRPVAFGVGVLIRPVASRRMHHAPVELSGFHAVKHALRFEAAGLEVWTDDRARALDLCARLAPDVLASFTARLSEVTDLEAVAPGSAHHTGVAGRAERPPYSMAEMGRSPGQPVFHLYRPVDPGNGGAAVWVAAAAGIAGVTVTGFDRVWGRACLRGSAGLHFALPVVEADLSALPRERSLIAFDPDGDPFVPIEVPVGAILAFGSERAGLAEQTLHAAERVVRLPMVDGVSSLNLATSISAALYAIALSD
jgi:TrmH family RNA methyltransferase